MRLPSMASSLSISVVRAVPLIAGLLTYLISPEDVVWRFIKAAPHARVLEHLCFGMAAGILGIALLLKSLAISRASQRGSRDPSYSRGVLADLLQAVGIGCLLPLPGFLLFVLGTLGVSLLLNPRHAPEEELMTLSNLDKPQRILPSLPWRVALVKNLGLFCAFVSMVIFSITLIDRVADVLFCLTALVSITAGTRNALRARTQNVHSGG